MTPNSPRQYTEEEVLERFLKQVWVNIDYWEGQYDKVVATYPCRRKLEGLAFSILAMLDGSNLDLPKFIVAPDPHPEDKSYLRDVEQENWYPENYDAGVECDLGGYLHELFHNFAPGEENED